MSCLSFERCFPVPARPDSTPTRRIFPLETSKVSGPSIGFDAKIISAIPPKLARAGEGLTKQKSSPPTLALRGPSPTILFVCAKNAFRSIFAESLFNARIGTARAQAISAGLKPASELLPGAVQVLKELNLDTRANGPLQSPKSTPLPALARCATPSPRSWTSSLVKCTLGRCESRAVIVVP
jgi:hypothetical protein